MEGNARCEYEADWRSLLVCWHPLPIAIVLGDRFEQYATEIEKRYKDSMLGD
jgi:hypothetical protein